MPAIAITKRIFSRVNCAQASGIFAIMFNEGSSATDYVTDVTDVTPVRNKEEEVWILDCIILGLKHRC